MIKKIISIVQNKYMKWGMLALWMILIFSMSHLDSVKSWYITGKTLNVIEQTSEEVEELTFDQEMNYYGEKSESMLLIRKLAHILEYLMLSLLLFNALIARWGYKKSLIVAVIISVSYAIIDELHQLIVPGRTGSIGDVALDGVGVVLGVLLLLLLSKFNKRFKIIV